MRTKALQIAFLATVLAAAIPSTMSAATIYTATLLGSNEVPPTGSTATGSITVTLTGDVLAVSEVFSGLTASASAAHIHCCGPIGVNEPVAVPFTGFPSATSGTYMNSFDLTLASTYTAAFLTANGGTPASAEAAFIAGLNTFQTYANIHDTNFPGGEIRGQLAQVPEPATVGLVLLAWAVFASFAGLLKGAWAAKLRQSVSSTYR
jgi:hypothetical protein